MPISMELQMETDFFYKSWLKMFLYGSKDILAVKQKLNIMLIFYLILGP